MAGRNWYRLKACYYFSIFLLTTPFYCLLTASLWIACNILRILNIYTKTSPKRLPPELRRTVLVTDSVNTKTLYVIRCLGKVGHRIIVVDSNRYKHSAGRWSKYVSQVMDVSHHAGSTKDKYIDEVVKVALDENVDWFVPISKTQNAMINYEVEQRLNELKPNIRCLGLGNLELARMLDNKMEFYLHCQKIGMSIPEFRVIQGIEDLRKLKEMGFFDEKHFFLKPVDVYSVDRLNFKRIPSKMDDFNAFLKEYEHKLKNSNYIVCEYIKGREFASNAICRNGQVLSFESAPTSSFPTIYSYEPNQKIKDWTVDFCRKMNISGALCFDFIQDDVSGEVYCIECNPRLHTTIITHHDNPELAKVFQAALEPESLQEKPPSFPVEPSSTLPRVYWLYLEFHKLIAYRQGLGEFFWSLLLGKEAVFDSDDPLPFLAMYTSNALVQLSRAIITGTYFKLYYPVIGRLVR